MLRDLKPLSSTRNYIAYRCFADECLEGERVPLLTQRDGATIARAGPCEPRCMLAPFFSPALQDGIYEITNTFGRKHLESLVLPPDLRDLLERFMCFME